ncbi:hypothetical protein CSC2_21610 [Clostridium zeae]|uniref:Uncharacterized protein n=1 Tax=Clostridium zeae TaxID=2759022 RepID=A0ABQ1EAG4_9CLOT|nr:hypothetical protein CSC2_21610 [Clostridium zeae]
MYRKANKTIYIISLLKTFIFSRTGLLINSNKSTPIDFLKRENNEKNKNT